MIQTDKQLHGEDRSQLMVGSNNESSPFTVEFFWVQGVGFRCMACQDEAGNWHEAFGHWALPGPIRILE